MANKKISAKAQFTARAKKTIATLLSEDHIESDVEQFFKKHIEAVVGDALGLRYDSFQRNWLFDRQRDDSVLARAIQAKADALIASMFAPVLENFTLKLKRGDMVAAQRAMQMAYERALSNALEARATSDGTQQGEADAAKILDQLLNETLKD